MQNSWSSFFWQSSNSCETTRQGIIFPDVAWRPFLHLYPFNCGHCTLHCSNQSLLITSWHTYLIIVIFLHWHNFWRIKFTPKKRVNYDKIHSKLPIFCVITAKYIVNCQIFALNLKKFTPAKKKLHEYIRGVRDKYQVWLYVIKLLLVATWTLSWSS